MNWETWRCGELAFTAKKNYTDPLMETNMTVTFLHEDGTALVRPAFWDGGSVWRVRFAPTKAGAWTYETHEDGGDAGLDGQNGSFTCVSYEGPLEIYRRGFVKVSENGRYFVYDDGTPFFYLGDTHWLMMREAWDTSNAEGIPSEFRFSVDLRVAQDFTVYQSEPLEAKYNLPDGLGEEDVRVFREEMDARFRYVADHGLLHTNAQLFFTSEAQREPMTAAFIEKMGVYWSARYGAYPVLWTVAQEVDPDFYGWAKLENWDVLARALTESDCYQHPLTGHMCNENRCNAENTVWGKKPFHSWYGMQPQNAPTSYYESFYRLTPAKPLVKYETGYERLWNSTAGAVDTAYQGLLNGCCGYGYGAHGVWNADVDVTHWMDYDGYKRWLEGMLLPGAEHLKHYARFCRAIGWWQIEPCYTDENVWSVRDTAVVGRIGDEKWLVYDTAGHGAPVELRALSQKEYSVDLFDPRTGQITPMGTVTPNGGRARLPQKPDGQGWLYVVSAEKFAWPLAATAENVLLTHKGAQVRLSASEEDVAWSVDDPAFAGVSADGTVTAMGRGGLFTVTAEKDGQKAKQTLYAVRQSETCPPEGPKKVTILPRRGGKECTKLVSPAQYLNLLPLAEPENAWYQEFEPILTTPEGEKSSLAVVNENFIFKPYCDGTTVVRLKGKNGILSDPVTIVAEGYGQPSLWLDVTATCDDWHPAYDERCLPQSAVNGSTLDFGGWTSEKVCSYDDPAVLTVTPKKPVPVNVVRVYTTSGHYMLKDFDIVGVENGEERLLKAVRDNTERITEIRCDMFAPEQMIIRCYRGDYQGHARVDQVSVYREE